MPELETAGIKAAILEKQEFSSDDVAALRNDLSESGGTQRLGDLAQELERRIDEAEGAEANQYRAKLGVIEYLLGRSDRAAEHLSECKNDGVACFYLGVIHKGGGRYDEAARSFEKAEANGYDPVEATVAKAGALRVGGKLDEAVRLLDEVEKKAGDSVDYLYERGCCLVDEGDVERAIELFEQALARDSQHQGALFALAYQSDRNGYDDKAVSLYERAAAQSPSHVGSLINLGILYEDVGRFGEAARCYNRVLSTYPDHPRARLFLRDTRSSRSMYYDEDAERHMSRFSQVLDIPVTDFELSVRSRNCLAKMNIFTLGHLTRTTEDELLGSKNFGETSLDEIKEILAAKGLRLGQALEEEGGRDYHREPEELSPKEVALLSKPLSELNLSVRARKCTTKLGINTIGELVSRTGDELLECKNFGVTSLNEVREKLRDFNLKLRND